MKQKMKRLTSVLLALVMVLGMLPFMSTTAMAATVLIGDVDGSGTVNKADSILLDRYVANWTGYADKVNMDAADVNRDGNVNKADAILLARYIANWTVESQIGQTVEVGEPEELKIVKEPLDVEFLNNVATLSITVSGEFDDIAYNWQKETSTGWRDATSLNSTDATYTVNNSALQITSKNGTEGLGKYRCIVSAFNKGSLVAQVTSRVADVDPQAAPLKATLNRPSARPYGYFYFYHTGHKTTDYDEEGRLIWEETGAYILKNYSTQARFEYMSTPLQLIPDDFQYDENGDPYYFKGSVDGYYEAVDLTRWDEDDNEVIYKDDNGDWWIIPAAEWNYYFCSIMSVSGGKGPYTYTWYLSKDKNGNDYNPLIEGKNCWGQGTEKIRVWPFEPSKGKEEPHFMGFLCCRITDSKGRTTNACYWQYGYQGGVMHTYPMIYALNENSNWLDSPNSGSSWWWTAPHNIGTGRWW